MNAKNTVHILDRGVAKKCGVNSALILGHLRFWIDNNITNNRNFHDGHYWTYQSMDSLCRTFDYLTASQIRTAIDKLVKGGYVLKGNYNNSSYNRTTWYAITEAGYGLFSDCESTNAPAENPLPICEEPQIEPRNSANALEKNHNSICEISQMELRNSANGVEKFHNSIRGEDNNTDIATDIATQMDDCAEASPPPPAPPVPPVFQIPLNDNSLFPVTTDMVAHWRELYPAVDVEQQLRKMIGWSESNPKKRKTRNGIMNFVNRWLAKEQDRGGNGYQAGYGQGGYYGNGNDGTRRTGWNEAGPEVPFGNAGEREMSADERWGIKSAF